jgi:hypothetical protein
LTLVTRKIISSINETGLNREISSGVGYVSDPWGGKGGIEFESDYLKSDVRLGAVENTGE